MGRSGPRVCAWASPLLLASAAALGAVDSPKSFTVLGVGPGVFAAIARAGDDSAVSNAGFVIGSEGVLVVDSFATAQAGRDLLGEIRRRTPLPVRWLVDTHHHLDHAGGNAVFAREGTIVVAHENVRAWIRADELGRREQVPSEDQDRFRGLVLPSMTYRDRLTIWLGDRRVEIFSMPGHTGGDSLVWVPDTDVVFGGDLVQKATLPNLANAKTDAWVRTLDGLAGRFPNATFVPGHGTVARPLDLLALRDYLMGLRLAVARAQQEGKSGDALSEAVLPRLRAAYGTWTWIEYVQDNVTQTEAELTGKKVYLPEPSP